MDKEETRCAAKVFVGLNKFIYLFRKYNRPKHDRNQRDYKAFQSGFLFDYFHNECTPLYLYTKNLQHFVECSCFLFLILLTFFQYLLFSLYILYQIGNNMVNMYQIGTKYFGGLYGKRRNAGYC